MHEIGLCQSVLGVVEGKAGGRTVTGVRLRVGALHRVGPEAFEQTFSMVAAGSLADGARVEVVVVPVQGHCRGCEQDWEANDQLPLCPECGATDVTLTGGDDLVLESLEFEAVKIET
ncbi:MAG: hydrogenase maturation nickel metallochaperone HypA [Acidimicrobiia bacterium]